MGLEEREAKRRRASVAGKLAGAELDAAAPKAGIVLQPKKGETKSQKFLASMPPSLSIRMSLGTQPSLQS
ncbi:MAG: hypothetical protein FWG10_02295 [Eubacteriaceae bacterium]|nr:hypothetical protein [Eubacteriaceae bacterium]